MSRNVHLCAATLITLGFSASAGAGDVCSTRGIAGNYVLKCSGFGQLVPNGPLAPFAHLSLEVRHKDGSFHGTGTASFGGVVGTHEYIGQTTVNSDCTGSETITQKFNGQPIGSATFNIVIGTDARQLEGINADQGNVVQCTATRMDNPPADNH